MPVRKLYSCLFFVILSMMLAVGCGVSTRGSTTTQPVLVRVADSITDSVFAGVAVTLTPLDPNGDPQESFSGTTDSRGEVALTVTRTNDDALQAVLRIVIGDSTLEGSFEESVLEQEKTLFVRVAVDTQQNQISAISTELSGSLPTSPEDGENETITAVPTSTPVQSTPEPVLPVRTRTPRPQATPTSGSATPVPSPVTTSATPAPTVINVPAEALDLVIQAQNELKVVRVEFFEVRNGGADVSFVDIDGFITRCTQIAEKLAEAIATGLDDEAREQAGKMEATLRGWVQRYQNGDNLRAKSLRNTLYRVRFMGLDFTQPLG